MLEYYGHKYNKIEKEEFYKSLHILFTKINKNINKKRNDK